MPPTPLTAALQQIDRRLTAILMALRPLIAQHFLRHPWVPNAVTVPLWKRFGRYARRLSRLLAAYAAGRLCPARARPGRLRAPSAAARAAYPPIPRQPGWMLAAMGHHVAVQRNALESLLADPAMAGFLAAAPAAGRILRPLCHMLGLPAPCPLPPRPLQPRPPRARPRRAPPPPGLSPQRPWLPAPLHPCTRKPGRQRPAPKPAWR